MKIVAFLPVKGTSERIANKNTKILDGKPLFMSALDKLISCEFIDEVYLDTESDEIINIASEKQCKVLKRDPVLANNKTDGHKLFYNEVIQVEADIYIQMLSTSPFIHQDTIKRGIEKLISSEDFDSVVLVRKEKQYTWNHNLQTTNYDYNNIPNSIDLEDTIIETMGLYIVKANAAKKIKKRIGEKPYLLEASALEAIDVNFPEDFELANFIAAGIREKERKLFRNISYQLNSPLLSDIMDELGFEDQIIKGLKLNLEGRKILGRAKTLKLKAKSESDESSIYDALLTYQTIVPNDIIVVENELPSYAYFGELNANLAIRAGAVGAIIGGNTRDHEYVQKLNFPVFSEGYNCQDIKNKGTVEFYNKKIRIRGIEINHEDLIFADSEGVVVIPKAIEIIVLNKAKEVLRKENNIVAEVSEGIDVLDIRSRYGDF
jgi:CMP-N-acetylneuraminic acid synthetase/regulator of RNase E activity RraA